MTVARGRLLAQPNGLRADLLWSSRREISDDARTAYQSVGNVDRLSVSSSAGSVIAGAGEIAYVSKDEVVTIARTSSEQGRNRDRPTSVACGA